ncbi:prolyl oligopeptidase family serine peptidase [Sphingomonas canadensis]|uniref:Prolyl oligopeptidase family serine peptidase n=1 Tax=Sphingomonas canadensis TaxID=1219257 RepID=A0ABW3HAQ2_9SPHN|nr:S9 family peptidase [Sphingomonas canadensis]MCW3836227.1 S9 family peptidase [Sphingomonas canadensis]
MPVLRPISLFLSALLALAAPAMAQPPKVMTPDLLTRMDRLTDAAVSPDGTRAAYVVRTISADLAKTATHILIADLAKPDAPHVAIAGGPARQDMPVWSADGRSLYFRGPDAAGINQIWRAGTDGSAPVKLTASPIDIGYFQIAPDGGFAVASLRVYPDCPTLACTVERAAKPQATTLYTKLNVRFFDAYGDGRYNSLFKLDLAGGKAPVALMPGFESDVPARPSGTARSFAISPDGATLVFAARRSGISANVTAIHRLFEVSLNATAAPREIGADLPGSHFNPVFSPDGNLLAYLDKAGAGSDGDSAAVRVRTLASGEVRELGTGFDGWPNSIAWSYDGKSLLSLSDDGGTQQIHAYPLSGKARRLPVAGGVSGLEVSKRGLLLTISRFDMPPQLFAASTAGGKLTQVTRVAADQLAGVPMAPTRSITFAGWNGDPVQAFVTEPLNREPDKKYPVLFLIHGGPHGVYQNEWLYGRNPQVWAAHGYATVMVNFHGSTGFGQKFAHDVLRHRGDRALEDLQKGWAAALAQNPFLDGDRGCAMGSSFGGYMIFWIAGVWNDPWKCLIAHAGTLDSRSYSSDILWHADRQMGGTPWDNPEGIEEFNAMRHVDKWKKPLLITHGGRDYRVPFDQGLAAFAIAQQRGIPSELLYMPNENHIISGAEASIRWYEVVDAWLDRWTKP